MDLDLISARVVRVHLDFDASLEFESGATVSFSEWTIAQTTYDEDDQFAGVRALAELIGMRCSRAEVTVSSVLSLEFDTGASVSASPRDQVESWEYTSPDGGAIVCLARGEIEAIPATSGRPAPAGTTSPVVPGSTAVRITTGADGGVTFSNGAVLHTDLHLDSAYLVLRETVDAVTASNGVYRIRLSSGYVLE